MADLPIKENAKKAKGSKKPWAERNFDIKIQCNLCKIEFKPNCPGRKYCAGCSIIQKRESHRISMNKYRKNNLKKSRIQSADWKLRTDFGITYDDYLEMSKKQGGKCAICETQPMGGRGVLRKLAVDHCHETGKIRALLCSDCNTGIGLFKESQKILESAVKYILAHGIKKWTVK